MQDAHLPWTNPRFEASPLISGDRSKDGFVLLQTGRAYSLWTAPLKVIMVASALHPASTVEASRE